MKEILLQKNGETMLELLTAFVIVLMAVAVFSVGVSSSLRLYRQSTALLEDTRNLNEAYFKQNRAETEAENTVMQIIGKSDTIEMQVGLYTFSDHGTRRFVGQPKQ